MSDGWPVADSHDSEGMWDETNMEISIYPACPPNATGGVNGIVDDDKLVYIVGGNVT